ncbi:hypothetical protein BU24DRAFT_357367 [Aaosphaeria arxii CBS 175.79]|uniref:Zn(2)-C6 fungal-type domain-containing protein n=1 Tax=Aaosphaeria arxii CBS 175.79 TaxID=1450172 RepID=A0A6A5XAZ3_9PLEO|nr:uncharacterized protein BU24DRAFT_357367 [Aaosphaeria arxii CBS 175.79]KAF2010132.1 hypothetical protein BU24DRAFT_357367 [Aaosphaeria arxii CBS 175.79]
MPDTTAPRKGTRRACDPCSIRKVRCDGNHPCARCIAASWDCTYLKTHGKSGPKGPRRTTEAAIRRLQERNRSNFELHRSDSETSLDSGSPSTADIPLVDHLPIGDSNLDGTGWPDILSPPLHPAIQREPQRISTSCISQYLEIFRERGYPIWPVIDTEPLIARLLTAPEDMEAYGLACAVCAVTISQFQIDSEPGSPVEGHFRVTSALFAEEAKRARELSDHLEHVTIWSVLGSFFLHVHSANVGRMSTSTNLLGEAITKAHIIGLHRIQHYHTMDTEQEQHSLRVYWLLFITERAHSIQHDVPTMLRRTPGLPQMVDLHDGAVTPAFIQLCQLFQILDNTLTADPSSVREALSRAQQQLSDDSGSRSLENELARADISMTQQWMRIFLWQHALGVTNLRTTVENDEFSFSYPATVAQNALSFLGTLSRQSLEAHGPGMESKLFDIATSLADVMICVPTINYDAGFSIGPRDLIHELSTLLASFRGGNPAVINILQEKMSALGLSTSSPRLLTDVSSSEDEHDTSRGLPQSTSWSDMSLYTPPSTTFSELPPAMAAMSMSM